MHPTFRPASLLLDCYFTGARFKDHCVEVDMRGKSLGLVGFLAVALGVGACQQKEANEPPKGKNGPVPSVTANGKSEGPSRVDVNLNTEKPETAGDEKETKISLKVLLP